MRELLYGAAYYDEYMPYERLEKGCCHDEKTPGSIRFGSQNPHGAPANRRKEFFDFSHVIRVMDAMEEAEI